LRGGCGRSVEDGAELWRLPWRTSHDVNAATLGTTGPDADRTAALALLDGWQTSAGAHLEMHVAHRVGMQIVIAKELDAGK